MWVLNMNELYEVYPDYQGGKTDEKEKVAKHNIEIDIPVDIKPDAKVGRVEIELCGEPVVLCDDCKKKPDSCRLVLVQKVRIKIPVKYEFKTKVGESMTDCCPPFDK